MYISAGLLLNPIIIHLIFPVGLQLKIELDNDVKGF